ncbi:hypothetical protein D3C78_1756470 [compost metagenome]
MRRDEAGQSGKARRGAGLRVVAARLPATGSAKGARSRKHPQVTIQQQRARRFAGSLAFGLQRFCPDYALIREVQVIS